MITPHKPTGKSPKTIFILAVIALGCAVFAVVAARDYAWLVGVSIAALAIGTTLGILWAIDRREITEKLKAYGEAKELFDNATIRLRRADDEARRITDAAAITAQRWRAQAQSDVDTARARAEELERRRAELDNACEAIRRKIEGYGDAFVVPSHSLLDELAENYAHTDPGSRLKAARLFSRKLAKSGQSSTCSDRNRDIATVAARFVTDAFNGKVDSIISEVKFENYGTLRQQVRDAYAEVNLGAASFKAAITEAYLDARLEELKWAVMTNEVRIAEREEQRAIREKLRDEEKARREYEKAMADAEKEEATIRKAMEKAQREIDKASSEQRAAFEAQLAELQGKLAVAEAKNQRALSMAQQTKAGHVYVISNIGSFGEEVFKVGMTRRLDPQERVDELGDASVPFEFDVHAIVYSDDAPSLENALHKELNEHRVNKVNLRKEFFRASPARLRELITARAPHAHFTHAAEAKEYRESAALDRRASTDFAISTPENSRG